MFQASEHGFQIDFANGLTVSVCFSRRNYCARRHTLNEFPDGCPNAEFVVFPVNPTNPIKYVYADNGGDYPYNGGWSSPESVAKAIAVVAAYQVNEDVDELRAKINDALK